ncbi:MAG: DUF1302 family protein [Thalassolituus sp.]|uniref:DUF1302 family protein n=1 Tax=Thalassolituus sp. TaxID=2030822 RepID=UPI00398272C1
MSIQSALSQLLILIGMSTQVTIAFADASISSEVETELALGQADSDLQKVDVAIKFDIGGNLANDIRYTFIPRLLMAIDSELYIDDPDERNYSKGNGPLWANRHGLIEISEAYVDFEAWKGYWRLGKQQVVWGQADGLKVLDVVNPQDLREFNLDDVEDSRIPLWMLNAEFDVTDDSSLQWVLIPDATYSNLADAGTPYFMTSSKYRPDANSAPFPVVVNKAVRPDTALDVGARYRLFLAGWDLTFNYLRHYQDVPVIYRRLRAGKLEVSPVYERNHLLGATASNAFGDWVVRMEVGYSTDTYQLRSDLQNDGIANTPEVSSVVGLDYRGFSDWFLSYQWFQSKLLDYDGYIVRNRQRMQHTLLLRRFLLNETLELELFSLYSDEDQDGQVRAKVSYLISDELRAWFGIDTFYGDIDGQFGQFNNTDRFVLGVAMSF